MQKSTFLFKSFLKVLKFKHLFNKSTTNDLNFLQRFHVAGNLVSTFATDMLHSSNIPITVIGKENLLKDQPIVIMSNHQSNLDILVLLDALDVHMSFISKIELSKIPFLTYIMNQLHCVFLDRSDLRQSASCIVDAIKTIQKGCPMAVFPEGTRSKDGVVAEFKSGAFKLATKPKVPIQPITITGILGIYENDSKYIKPNPITVTIHKPIYTDKLTKDGIKNLPSKTRDIIISAL